MAMLELDGAQGDCGGQILRSALSLSLVTGTPFHIVNIRAGRRRPGILRQHLTAIEAAAAVSGARAAGADVGSAELTFAPGAVRAGEHRFAVGTAGSATLVFQTIFPALALASGPSEVAVEGGTHNPMAPPFEFLARAYLPLVARMGPRAAAVLERPGFYPAGGGRLRVRIEPAPRLGRLELLERGEVRARRATATVALLPRAIAARELAAFRERTGWSEAELAIAQVKDPLGPGNVLAAEVESASVTEIFTGFGERGVAAERVGAGVGEEVRAYLAAGVPVGPHLADQLLLPMALGGGGVFRTVKPSAHTRTHAALLRAFVGCEVRLAEVGDGAWEVEVSGRG